VSSSRPTRKRSTRRPSISRGPRRRRTRPSSGSSAGPTSWGSKSCSSPTSTWPTTVSTTGGRSARTSRRGDWAAWFASYRPFILHYAADGRAHGLRALCVGCELGTTAVHAAEWRQIVAAVKGVYAGPLTYADNQVEYNPNGVTWWDAVDFIGQDAYPTLTQVVEPTVEDLMSGWVPFRDKLQALAERWDKPSS